MTTTTQTTAEQKYRERNIKKLQIVTTAIKTQQKQLEIIQQALESVTALDSISLQQLEDLFKQTMQISTDVRELGNRAEFAKHYYQIGETN